ncbi:hypothetical protein ACH5RR_039717 [Cinchona calisaya]|uniref:DDE Tnp4 domain-containing protein n=1 Tax=Cinchona calisaya TaxID=153742 RepID=A0ABD2XZ33_9GENT
MTLEEIVAMFVYVLAHHKKNRTVAHKFLRSGETVSRHFNQCLLAVLKLHHMLLKTPVPISDDCTDDRWKYFKNCLGALDGTLISVTPPAEHKSRYRTRKSNLATNVLGVCAPDMQFIYVLPGWEGSAHDGRVLRDAISRPNGLKVPQGLPSSSCNTFPGFWTSEPYSHSSRYHAITEMVKQSGCEWDNVEKIIKCERQWYDSWAKRHKEARGLWNMKFPYLDELELVYGKDRANGEAVEDYEDAVNNFEAEEKSAEAASYVNCETDDDFKNTKETNSSLE